MYIKAYIYIIFLPPPPLPHFLPLDFCSQILDPDLELNQQVSQLGRDSSTAKKKKKNILRFFFPFSYRRLYFHRNSVPGNIPSSAPFAAACSRLLPPPGYGLLEPSSVTGGEAELATLGAGRSGALCR